MQDVIDHAPRNSPVIAQARAAEEDLVRSLGDPSRAAPPRGGHVRVHSIDVQPAFTVLIIDRPHGRRQAAAVRDHLYAQWFYRRSPKASWAAFSAPVSGTQTLLTDPGDRWFAITPYVPTTTCLRSGQYRVELYVRGRLEGTAQRTFHIMPTRPAALSDLNLSVCTPPHAWTVLPAAARLPGTISGYASPQARSGMLVVDASAASAAIGTDDPSWYDAVLDRVMHRLRRRLPGPLRESWAEPGYPFLGGSDVTVLREYAYRGGTLHAALGATPAGRTLVAIVYGPHALFKAPRDGSSKATNVLASIVTPDVSTDG
jgi:hypothetical protein